MKSTRARRAVLAVACAVVATAWAADRVVVEDWRSYPLGTRGIPGEWKEQNWGKPAYDFEIVSDGRLVLTANNEGVPFVSSSPEAPISQGLRQVAGALVAVQSERGMALAGRT